MQPGDYILVRGRAVYVVKVNAKTIKIADPKVHYANGKMWELTYKLQEVQKLLATREVIEANSTATSSSSRTNTRAYTNRWI